MWHAELRLNRSRASFDASAIAGVLPAIYNRPVTKLMHKGELWYVKGEEPTVLDAVKDMVLRGQVRLIGWLVGLWRKHPSCVIAPWLQLCLCYRSQPTPSYVLKYLHTSALCSAGLVRRCRARNMLRHARKAPWS